MNNDLNKIKDILILMGVTITKKRVVWDSDNGNQVFMRGDFAGASINSLAKFYADQTGRKIKVNCMNFN